MTCPNCGTDNPEGARFCNACGTRLGAGGGDAALDPFLPKELLAKLEAARAGRAMEGERRVVTMLFCDVKGSTAMAETMDAEDWAEIMNGAFERLIAPVYRYEGTLARLMGDAIFAFFGAPIAHEDDPQRAVQAGLDIVAGIAGYKERIRAERGLDLDVRVGINTGPVMVGQVGSDLRLEYTAMGDAVNVAARMEQTAEPGTVQITAETQRLVEPYFDLQSRGGIEVKGKAEPVSAFRVLGRKAGVAEARSLRGSPLVGREREMRALRDAIQEARSGRGRIVSLVGEAGLGKSRLIQETRAEWERDEPGEPSADGGHIAAVWESWQCVSYDASRPYAQYRREVARLAGIEDTDPPQVVRDKLTTIIEPGSEAEWLEPHMRVWRSLFGVTELGEEPLEGQAFRDAILELVTGSTREFTGDTPRLLVFEDLHWCDEASMDVLIETARLVDDIPCLFVFAYRPDRQAQSWRLKQWLETEYPHRSTELALAPLSDDDSGRLIDALIPGEAAGTRTQILERTDGNPLFLEEVAIAMLEHDEIAIPDTLQALFTTRLDALDEDCKHTLQLASVIGRSFSEPVLRAVAGNAEVTSSLRTLERMGLISETARTPDREYAFHHSLTQDATYGTILRRRRRELHARVGEVLEERFANRLDEFAPVLAYHFLQAGDDQRTLRYASLAGDNAARLYANAEAAAQYGDAIEAARRLGTTPELIAHLYPSRGRVLEISGRYEEAVSNYEDMGALAAGSADRTGRLGADMALTTLYATPTPVFDAARGRELAERTIDLARDLGDRSAESKALWNLMILNVFGGGDTREAVEAGERSLAIARELNAREQIAFTLNDLWRPYAAEGDIAAARACLDEVRPMWREMDNLPMLCENLSSTAALLALAGRIDEAIALYDEAYATAQRIGNPWGQAYSLFNSYLLDIERGNLGRAMQKMRECIERSEEAGFVVPLSATRADLGVMHARLGQPERGLELVEQGLEIAREKSPLAVPMAMVAKADILLVSGEIARAEEALSDADLRRLPAPVRGAAGAYVDILKGQLAEAAGDHAKAIEIAEAVVQWLLGLELRQFLPSALLLKGRVLAERGDRDEAEAVLGDAKKCAEELGFLRPLWEIEWHLSRLAAGRDDGRAATELAGHAASILRRMAETVDADGLRESFLAVPNVRAVLEAADAQATSG